MSPDSPIVRRLQDECALDSTYAKACDIAGSGGVLTCAVERSAIDGVVRLSGAVRASSGPPYHASATLDLGEGDVVGYGCTCPASYSYDGMCKHSAALVLCYLDGTVAGGQESEPPGNRQNEKGPHATRDLRAPQRPSSPQLSRLFSAIAAERVDAAAARRALRTAREDLGDPADFEVTLLPASTYAYGTQTWLLKLRVRRGRASYIVRNMGELVRARERHAELSYGENLSFVHTPGAFTERARAILGLAARIVHSQQALFSSRYKYWDAGRWTDVKELPLSDADVVELLDLLQGSSFTFDPGTGYLDLPRRTLEVVSGDPAIRAAVEVDPRGGFDLRLPASLACFAAGNVLYVLDDDRAWRCSEGFSRRAGTLLGELLPARAPLHVAPHDVGPFCRTVLPVLDECCELALPDALRTLRPPEPRFTFEVGLEDGEVSCRATVTYGERTLGLYEPQRPGQPSRDLAAEYQAQDAVEAYFPGAGPLPRFDESDDELLYLLLTEGLRELSELGEVLLSERLRAVEVRDSPQVRIKAVVKSGLLDLEVGASGLTARDLADYLASYRRKQRFLRLSNGDIVKLDGSVRVLDDLAQGLGVEAAELSGGVRGIPSNRTLFVDALLKKAANVRFERDAGFRAIVRDFDTFSDADFEVPASLLDVLRPYQVDGFRWLETLERLGFGGILADDMGLGKTLQVVAHILARKEAGETGATLVVCPASLVYNWMAELARFAPQLDAVAVVGGKAARRAAIAAADGRDVLVTSYDLMKRDVEEYAAPGRMFARVVLDEAQYIKNPATQAAKCAKCLPSKVRVALTGTPIENRLSELWSIFDFLIPGILGGRDAFAKRFEGPVEHGEQGSAERLRCMVAPFVLRRLKADVLADLPEKSENVVFARMEGEQEKLYRANQDRLALQISHELPDEFKRSKLQVLAELTKLRQICCDPRLYYEDYAGGSAKLETCMELVRTAVDAGHRVLLFSQFTSMLELVAERLRTEKVGHLVLTGSTSKEERAQLVERFQAGGEPVFLISLKAGGVGLNLTAADVVIHYDPWWNLAAQNQATDRAHRIGQTRAVSVFQLVVQDTVEERIVQMQQRKHDLAESVLGGEEMASASLSREDVLALLGAGA